MFQLSLTADSENLVFFFLTGGYSVVRDHPKWMVAHLGGMWHKPFWHQNASGWTLQPWLLWSMATCVFYSYRKVYYNFYIVEITINMFVIPHLLCFGAQFNHINSCMDSNLVKNSNLMNFCSIVTIINICVTLHAHVRKKLFRILISEVSGWSLLVSSGPNQSFSSPISSSE